MSLTSNYAAIAARKPKGPTKKKHVWLKPVKRSQRIQIVELGVGKGHFRAFREPSDREKGPIKTVSGGLPNQGKKR